jgi:hypothetical protein
MTRAGLGMVVGLANPGNPDYFAANGLRLHVRSARWETVGDATPVLRFCPSVPRLKSIGLPRAIGLEGAPG